MCGILGIAGFNSKPVDVRLLERMTDVMRHRGPDGRGFVRLDPSRKHSVFWDRGIACDGGSEGRGTIGLGHRRLSILDLEGGVQPMSNENGTVWITFNGEIYNFYELRDELCHLGHRFRTHHSDTETIVHAYEQWGEGCLQRLRGMFAFGLADLNRKRLFLARDRVGIKPLVYYAAPDRMVFASEIKAILEDASVPREIDLTALADYFTYGYIPSPKTIFKNIHKLEPGHYLWVDLEKPAQGGSLRSSPYWEVCFEPDESVTENEWCERLRAEFTEAVRLRMVSDVPLGAFLSGGVDSSTVVALMSRLQDKPVKTFTIGMEEATYNETPYARHIARRYRSDHHEEIVKPDAIEVLPRLAWQYDEPFADFSAIPTHYVSQMARKRVTVVLSGDGGDEVFAGYEFYLRAAKFRRWVDPIPYSLRKVVFGGLCHLLPDLVKGRNYAELFARHPDERYRAMRESSLWQRLFRPEVRAAIGEDYTNPFLSHLWDRARHTDYTTRMQYVDLKSYLPEDILVKVDKASMLNSLEVRVPILDHKVIELAARIPSRLKLNGHDGKYIMKRMMMEDLGRDFLYRKKMGFGIPLTNWFRRDLQGYVREMLLEGNSFTASYIQPRAIRQVLRNHELGLKDLTGSIWSMLFLEHWGRCYITQRRTANCEGHE